MEQMKGTTMKREEIFDVNGRLVDVIIHDGSNNGRGRVAEPQELIHAATIKGPMDAWNKYSGSLYICFEEVKRAACFLHDQMHVKSEQVKQLMEHVQNFETFLTYHRHFLCAYQFEQARKAQPDLRNWDRIETCFACRQGCVFEPRLGKYVHLDRSLDESHEPKVDAGTAVPGKVE